MDGFETCRRIKASPTTKDVPVTFLTGQGEIEKVVQGFELGADMAQIFLVAPRLGEFRLGLLQGGHRALPIIEMRRRVSTHIELYQLQRSLSREVKTKTG